MRNQTSRTPSLLLSGIVVLICMLGLGWSGLRQYARADSPSGASSRQEKVKKNQEVEKKNPAQDVLDILIQPEPVEFPGPNNTTLRGYIYKPAGEGRHKAIIWNHGSEPHPKKEEDLGRFYAGNGYVFFLPHRSGQGLSSDQGEYIGNKQKLCDEKPDPRKCRVDLHDVANHDVVAAVAWLKTRPFVDPSKIVMSGCSYGGIQTLLAAEKGLGIRAFVPFAPGAMSWANTELRDRLKEAIKNASGPNLTGHQISNPSAPIFLIQAQGDFSLGPYEVLGDILKHRGGLNGAKLYPKFGESHMDAHGVFATKLAGIKVWRNDVLHFFDQALGLEN